MKKKFYIVLSFLFIIIPVGIYLSTFFSGSPLYNRRTYTVPTSVPINNTAANTLSPLQKTNINKTTDNELKSNPNIINNRQLADGSTEYTFKSVFTPRPDIARTQNGIVYFERIKIPDTPGVNGYVTLGELIQKYGNPEKIIRGSNFYGSAAIFYIYASKGITIIGNKDSDSVYEVQVFKPISMEEYINTYNTEFITITPRNNEGQR